MFKKRKDDMCASHERTHSAGPFLKTFEYPLATPKEQKCSTY